MRTDIRKTRSVRLYSRRISIWRADERGLCAVLYLDLIVDPIAGAG